MRMLQDGQVIRETYEVERFLGEGAFAEVYRVKHRFLGRQAMKVFKRVGMNLDEIQEMLGEAILLTHIKQAAEPTSRLPAPPARKTRGACRLRTRSSRT